MPGVLWLCHLYCWQTTMLGHSSGIQRYGTKRGLKPAEYLSWLKWGIAELGFQHGEKSGSAQLVSWEMRMVDLPTVMPRSGLLGISSFGACRLPICGVVCRHRLGVDGTACVSLVLITFRGQKHWCQLQSRCRIIVERAPHSCYGQFGWRNP